MKTYFKIKPHDNPTSGGFDISIGVGKTFHAKDEKELVYAIEHYFRVGIFTEKYDYAGHIKHNKECDCCPICRG